VKKVRYLMGAVGAAPALGLIMPTAPAAAVATHSAKAAAKQVSLGHSAAGAPAASAVTAATSCKGTTEVHSKNAGYSNTFWYTKAASGIAICVGTVEGAWFTPPLRSHPSFDFRIRVWSGSPGHLAYSTRNGANTTLSGHINAGQTIRRWYGGTHGGPIQVCTAWVSNSSTYQNSVWIGPVCKTLP
jgi:hypothetical protein